MSPKKNQNKKEEKRKKQFSILLLSDAQQLLAYTLGSNFSEQAIVLSNESDSYVHTSASPPHHQLQTLPALKRNIG